MAEARVVKIGMTAALLGEHIALLEGERIVGVTPRSEPAGSYVEVFIERPVSDGD